MTEVSSFAAKSSLCSRCKETKSADQFRPYRGNKLFSYCIACEKEYKAKHYRKNADRYAEKQRKWNAENRERYLEINRAYNRSGKRNLEIYFARIREWKAKNKPLLAYYCRTRHAAKRNAIPAWADLDAIKRIYEEAALRRAETGEEWHVDHIVPLKGKTVCGLHCEANLRIISKAENIRKGASYWPDMP